MKLASSVLRGRPSRRSAVVRHGKAIRDAICMAEASTRQSWEARRAGQGGRGGRSEEKKEKAARQIREAAKAEARGFKAKADLGLELGHQHQLPLPPDSANVQFGRNVTSFWL